MILPGRHLPANAALLTVGARVLVQLDRPRDVSALWDRVREADVSSSEKILFDQFTLALAFLYAIGAVDDDGSTIRPAQP
ncbi:MAG: ABC-three component system middle component 6 [Pseudomonadota bacterium]